MDQNYFVTPFASLGDQTSIPIPTDSGGAVSMQQGWGPDYARDQTSDPLAKPIDRATTNWLFFVITQALSALQRTGIPEWISSANNNGTPLAYPKYAQVRYSATSPGVTFETYVSTVDNNTSVPGADANWQPIASIVAAAADVVAGTSSRLPVTPLTLKSYPGNSAQTFNVKTATGAAHAVPLAQMQAGQSGYAGEIAPATGTTLDTTFLGQFVVVGGGNSYTLAALSTFPIGSGIVCCNSSTVQIASVSPTGTDTISLGSTTTVNPFLVQPGQTVKFVKASSTSWRPVGMSTAAVVPLPVATATSGTHAVPLAQMQAGQGGFSGAVALTNGQTVTAALLGELLHVGNGTYNLDAVANFAVGNSLNFINNTNTLNATIVQNGTDIIVVGSTQVSSIIVPGGQSLRLTKISSTSWRADGTATADTIPPTVAGLSGVGAVGVVGTVRNLQMSVAAASASGTLTADEIIVESALGGTAYKLASFNKTVNLATTGAGGMDTGTAPVSGYVALYAIYNPTTGASALLATNATAAIAPEVYGGANMPAGYTASALVSVWGTNASGQFIIGYQRDRKISRPLATVLNVTTASTSTGTIPFSVASAVPLNACAVDGRLQLTFTQAGSSAPTFAVGDSAGLGGGQWLYASGNNGNGQWGNSFVDLPILRNQTMSYSVNNSVAISVTFLAYVTGYRF